MNKLLFLIFSLFLNNSFAQAPSNAITAKVESVLTKDVDYNSINKEIAAIEDELLKNPSNITITSDYIRSLNGFNSQVLSAKQEAEKNLTFVEKRIGALGELPENGAKETFNISKRRKEFNAEKDLLKSKIAEADLILTKIDEIENIIVNMRNKVLLENILDRQTSIIYPKNFLKYTKDFTAMGFNLLKLPLSWYESLSIMGKNTFSDKIILVLFSVLISLMFAVAISLYVRKHFGYRQMEDEPDYGKKLFAAFAVFVAYGVIPCTVIGAFDIWVHNTSILIETNFGAILNRFILLLIYIFTAKATVKALFAPKSPKWRLINVPDIKAKKISFAIVFSVAIILFFELIQYAAVLEDYSPELILYIKFISSAVKTFCIILTTNRFFCEKNPDEDTQEQTDENAGLSIFTRIKILVYSVSVIIFSLSFFGYINLADYILDRCILSLLILGSAYIINNTLKVMFQKLLNLRFWIRNLRFKRKTLNIINVWFGLLLNPIILAIAVFILLGLWGASTDLMLQNIKKFLSGFYIGDVKISITSIALGIVVFFVSMSVFKVIKIKLLTDTLVRMDMDYSVRNSLASGFGFFGFIASAIFSIAVMGGNFKNLALVAGALSFGIGLGLQNIISNFVSGLILLFERPIKIGDVVNINGQEGTVKQINIRATELETSTKASIIIPNATILSSSLINLTRNNRQTRVDIPIAVDYKNNVEEVMAILIDATNGYDKIMPKPEPAVSFNDFSSDILNFTLSCYINDIANKQDVLNDLRSIIVKKFNEHNITVPLHRVAICEQCDIKKPN